MKVFSANSLADYAIIGSDHGNPRSFASPNAVNEIFDMVQKKAPTI